MRETVPFAFFGSGVAVPSYGRILTMFGERFRARRVRFGCQRGRTVASSAHIRNQQQEESADERKKKASAIPTPDEDREVAHEAYLHAFQEAQPQKARIPGMQEFASAILARARIPSQQYSDPLMHIFDVRWQ